MPSPITAISLITRAMIILGATAPGETPTSNEANDGLAALNDVLETWSTESYAVYAGLSTAFVTVAGQSTYSIGPGGNWAGDRPTSIDDVFITVSGVDFVVLPWTLSEYDAVPIKSQQQPIAERFVYINDAPLGRVILYPTPSQAVPITINAPRILTQIPTLSTTITLPPGYVRALQYAVAVELAPQYGIAPPVTQYAAMMSVIKRANRQSPVMGFDSTLLGGAPFIGKRGY